MAGPWDKYKGGVQTKPADPRLPYQVTKDRNDAAASQYAPPKAAADTTIAQANAANAAAIAAAERDKAIADAKRAEVELEKLKTEQSKVDPKSGAYKALQDQIDRVTELYRQNLQGGAPNAVNNVIPDFFQPSTGAFDSAAQGLVNPFMAAFKVPGQGSQSDTELRQFLSANTPQQGDPDAVIEEKIRNIQTRLNAEKPPQVDKSSALPPIAGEQGDQTALSKDGTRTEIDPILKGVAARASQMITQGAPEAAVNEFLRKNGSDPANSNIRSLIQWRNSPEGKNWLRANPGKSLPVNPDFYTRKIPLTPMQKVGNAAAQSGPGAYAINFAQGVTGNRLDNIAGAVGGDPEAINTGIQLSRSNSPTASFMGDLGGQATAQYLLNKVPGFRALPNSSVGRLADDAIYGAYAGSGDEESGAVNGILSNVIGGKVGRGIGKGVGVAARGVNPKQSLAYLNEAGVPLTIGQIGRGTDSTVGNAIGGAEERLAGIWPFDSIINPARQRGDIGFNQAAFRELGGSGVTGSAGISEGRNLVNNAYGFLDSANLPLDAQFAGRNAMVRAGVPGLPDFGKGVTNTLGQIDNVSAGGVLPGRMWRDTISDVRADRSSIAGQPFSRPAVNSLNEVEGNLLDLAARQGPAGTLDNLANANHVNAKFQTLASALDNGPAQRAGELFSPSRLNDASRQGARSYGGRTSSMEGNRPFYDLTRAGMDVMPNLTPDSGTAGRALFYSMVPVLGGGTGAMLGGMSEDSSAAEGGTAGASYGLIPTLAMSALYSKRGQKGLQKALLGPRPQAIENTVKSLMANPVTRRLLSSRASGMFGSALSRDLSMYPELDPGF